MKKIGFFILMPTFIAAAAVTPQSSGQPLGWNQIVEKARQENPEVQSAESSLQALRFTEKAAASNYFPQLTGNLSYTQGNSTNLLGISDSVTTYSASLTATQNLFSGFLDQGRVDQAKANTRVSEAALNISKAKISYDLKTAYAGLLYAEKNLNLSKDILRRREGNLRLVDLRFDSGRENKGSVLLSKAYLEQAKLDILQSQNSILSSQVQLAKVTGTENPESLFIQGEVPTREISTPPDLKSLVQRVPEVIQAHAQEESARAGFKISESGFYPSLNLTGTTGNAGPDWYPTPNRWSVGATLSFPLFSGGRDYYGRRSSQESWRAAIFNSETQAGQVYLKLQQTFATYLESTQKLTVDQAFLDALTVQERISKEKYNNGLLSFEEWDKIENDLISRQKVILQTQRDRVVNEAAWEQAQGQGVIP